MNPQDRPRLPRRRLLAVLLALVLAAAFQPVAVSIANFSFTPASVTIARGCSVKWTQTSTTKHTTSSTTGVWDSGQLSQNQTFTRQFTSAGTFAYQCTIHPGSMQGTITVN